MLTIVNQFKKLDAQRRRILKLVQFDTAFVTQALLSPQIATED